MLLKASLSKAETTHNISKFKHRHIHIYTIDLVFYRKIRKPKQKISPFVEWSIRSIAKFCYSFKSIWSFSSALRYFRRIKNSLLVVNHINELKCHRFLKNTQINLYFFILKSNFYHTKIKQIIKYY